MSKYLAFFQTKIRNLLEYRVNFALIILSSILPLFALYFLWNEIYAGQVEIRGMNFSQIFTYYILASLLTALLNSETAWNVSDEIRAGTLNNHLIRPYSYLGLQFTTYLSDQIVLIVLLICVFLLSNLFLRGILVPFASLVHIVLFFINLSMATVLTFYVSYLIGLVAFFWEEIKGLFYFQVVVLQLFSGSIIPLDWYPASIGAVIKYLPFSYMVYFPIKIYLGQISADELLFNFGLMVVWIAVLHLTIKLIWRKGIKIYRGHGG